MPVPGNAEGDGAGNFLIGPGPIPAVESDVMLGAVLPGVPSGDPSRGGNTRPPLPSPVLKSETPRDQAEWHSMQWPMVTR